MSTKQDRCSVHVADELGGISEYATNYSVCSHPAAISTISNGLYGSQLFPPASVFSPQLELQDSRGAMAL